VMDAIVKDSATYCSTTSTSASHAIHTQCIVNTIFSGPKSSRIFRGKEFLG
jgi:hypothetical protein